MKNIILTVMLLGLLTSVSFAQRGAAGIGGNRGITQIGPSAHQVGPTAQIGRPNAVGTTPTTVRPNAVPMAPSASRTNASGSVKPNAVDTQRVAPPDAVGNPNAGGRVLQQ
jgi:hypothetical protein